MNLGTLKNKQSELFSDARLIKKAKSMQQKHPYEESFLLALLLIALVSLIWLFNQFIPAFLFALLLATSSYSLFQKLSVQPRMNANRAAMLMTTAAFLVVFLPISYLLAESGRMGAEVFN
ncbi:MAG: hypothetical protein B7Y18_02165, partial [Thiotrichales bacterium 24-47-4]